jgi:hypothetical protein
MMMFKGKKEMVKTPRTKEPNYSSPRWSKPCFIDINM